MKKKSLLLCSAALLLSVGALTGCGGSGKTITLWVGSESTAFYQKVANEYVEAHSDFGYKVKVTASDAGAAAGAMVQDNSSCADIVTIAHDNIGKLSQLSYIAPITSESLLKQINDDNPASFKGVIKNTLGTGTDEYVLAVPYVSQALFLYYDTRYVSAEQAQTFEGLQQAAAAVSSKTKAVAVTGTDGFNFSFTLLGRNITKGNTSSLKLYEGGAKYATFAQDNEEVAIARWAQRYLADPNGLFFPDDAGWEVNVNNHNVISVIGGAWHYNAFKNVVTGADGKVNMGCAIIPTFTLTAADVEGIGEVDYPAEDDAAPEGKNAAPVAGTVMRGGSFVDCKCFVINMAAANDEAKYNKLQELIQFLSSKDVQNRSFLEAMNVPAYEGSDAYISSLTKDQVDETVLAMAKAQTGMNPFGIAQPFVSGTLNTYYYSKSCPDYYKEMLINESGKYNSVQSVREVLFKMEYVYKHGGLPASVPQTLPGATDAKIA